MPENNDTTDDDEQPTEADWDDEELGKTLLEARAAGGDAIASRLLDHAEGMEEDPSVDFESSQRQDEGWLQVYVECPDCEVPMARTVVDSAQTREVDGIRVTESELHAVCPECHEMMTVLELTRKTGPFDDLA